MRVDSLGAAWAVGDLVGAIGQAVAQTFNPVRVKGEISGFTRAVSGHCYFSLKDARGQIRCAMFKRAAAGLSRFPKEGDQVEVTGRLDVYAPRGDLQLVVETLETAGQGDLYEQFLRVKAKLQGMGLFDSSRKRALPRYPRHIGVVTSLGAAALHYVVSVLRGAPLTFGSRCFRLQSRAATRHASLFRPCNVQACYSAMACHVTSYCWFAAVDPSKTCGPSTTRAWRSRLPTVRCLW